MMDNCNAMDGGGCGSSDLTPMSAVTNGCYQREVSLCHVGGDGDAALMDRLWTSYRNGLHVDVVIVCREHQYSVHKVIASAFSSVLRSLLTSNWQPNPSNAIQIDCETGAVRLDYVVEQGQDIGYLIEFMYTGQVTVPRDCVQSLLRMAEVLHVKTLSDTIMGNHQSASTTAMADAACLTFVHAKHGRHFREVAWAMVNEGHAADTSIVYRDLCVRAHKPILSAMSPVLRSYFLTNDGVASVMETDGSNGCSAWAQCGLYQTARGIQFDYIAERTDDVLCLLEFAYRGRTVASDSGIDNLLLLAEKLEVRELVDAITSRRQQQQQDILKSQPTLVSSPAKKNNSSGNKHAKDTKAGSAKCVPNGIGSKSKAERIGIGDRPRPQHRCHLCPFTSPHKQRLIQHLASIHRLDDRGNLLPDIASQCTLCDFSCSAPHQLTQHHIKCHCKAKPYRCSLCDYATVLESELERHVRNRHPDRQRHECSTCGFLARTKTGLTLHVRMHQRPKPHQCSVCDECFTSLEKLKTHCKRKHDIVVATAAASDNGVNSEVVEAGLSRVPTMAATPPTTTVAAASASTKVAAPIPDAVVDLPAVPEPIAFLCPECGVDCHTADMLRLHVDMYHVLVDNRHPIRGDIVRVVSNEEVTELRVL